MSEQVRVIAFAGTRLVLRSSKGGLRLPFREELEAVLGSETLEGAAVALELPFEPGRPVRVFGLDEGVEMPDPFRLDGLRVAWHTLDTADFRLAGVARQKLEWRRTHRFCSRCGSETERDGRHEAMKCTDCGQLHFPRIAPAVIVLVEREAEILLGRSPHFNPGVYSTLAGFVEAGESLEECVHREIAEEVGVRVSDLRYFGSQPHPFPHSLMIGFTAKWLEGEIRIDPQEIEDARWFTADALPELPHPMSIARALIEDFRRRGGS